MKEKEYYSVQYDGEFVLTRNGSKDFGEIPAEIAQQIRRQAGKIRLRIGEETGNSGDYGEKHIERMERSMNYAQMDMKMPVILFRMWHKIIPLFIPAKGEGLLYTKRLIKKAVHCLWSLCLHWKVIFTM